MCFFTKEEIQPTPSPTKPKFIVPPWMLTAINLQGTKEDLSSRSNPMIMNWVKIMDNQVQRDYTNDDIPWCGLFTGYCLEKNGFDAVDKPLWARNWADYGIKLSEPVWGCIGSYRRGSGGHVGFIVGEDQSRRHHYLLGGNQNDAVNVTTISKVRLIAATWPFNAADCIRVPLNNIWRPTAIVPPEVLEAIQRTNT